MQKNKEEGNLVHPRTLMIIGIVLAAAALRLAPHPMNFAPIGALALFEELISPASERRSPFRCCRSSLVMWLQGSTS